MTNVFLRLLELKFFLPWAVVSGVLLIALSISLFFRNRRNNSVLGTLAYCRRTGARTKQQEAFIRFEMDCCKAWGRAADSILAYFFIAVFALILLNVNIVLGIIAGTILLLLETGNVIAKIFYSRAFA